MEFGFRSTFGGEAGFVATCFNTIPILFPLKGWHISTFGVCPLGHGSVKQGSPWGLGVRRARTSEDFHSKPRQLGRVEPVSSVFVATPTPTQDPQAQSASITVPALCFVVFLVGVHGPKSHEQADGCSWKGVTSNGWLHAGGLDLNKFLLEVCQTWSNKQIKNQALFTKLC